MPIGSVAAEEIVMPQPKAFASMTYCSSQGTVAPSAQRAEYRPAFAKSVVKRAWPGISPLARQHVTQATARRSQGLPPRRFFSLFKSV